MFDEHTLEELKQPLLKEHVATRKNFGGGPALSYIEGWHAIAEANRVFGFEGWDRETVKMANLAERNYEKDKKEMFAVGYMATVRVTVRAGDTVVVREGTGFGDGQANNSVTAHELAVKEAETDAMKRALMTFGNQFGLALYDKKQTNVVSGHASAAEARKEGVYEKLIADMQSKQTVNSLDEWWVGTAKEKHTDMPKGWLDNLKEAFKAHKLTLQQLEAPAGFDGSSDV
ncbi:MAG: RAD52 family DNA repair protein [Desulfobacteraceae bacterium]|nr:RAD52 family DNA repair protein [Desulfobacteraceae bacterium]